MSTARSRPRRAMCSLVVASVALIFSACSIDGGSDGDDRSADPVDDATEEAESTAETAAASDTGSTLGETTTPDEESDTENPPSTPSTIAPDDLVVEAYPVPEGSRPHDVAPAADGGVWYTAQNLGELGWLDPITGETVHIDLGDGARPHGVIVDDVGVAWITDGGLNAIVAYDAATEELTSFPLPADRPDANLNTATFDANGILWFTGQNGVYGSLDPTTGDITVHDAPRGRGPYGIHTTPDGAVYLASLAGSYIGAINPDAEPNTNANSTDLTVIEPPTPNQGARRVWSDSEGSIWVSEWNSGNLSRYTPSSGQWDTWPLPATADDGTASTYAVYVDERDVVWTSDFTANALVRFDPATEQFTQLPLPHDPGDIRQILGRPGEVWGAESAANHLVVVRTTG